MEFILCAFGGNVSGINWFARICQERASAWLQPVLLKLIPQRFTAVNQALTCPYDVWIYYSKCCVGPGDPLILAPGDHLCFRSKEHLENGPGRLNVPQCLWTHATVQTQGNICRRTSQWGLFGWNHCLQCVSVFQKCLIDHTNLSSIYVTLPFMILSNRDNKVHRMFQKMLTKANSTNHVIHNFLEKITLNMQNWLS